MGLPSPSGMHAHIPVPFGMHAHDMQFIGRLTHDVLFVGKTIRQYWVPRVHMMFLHANVDPSPAGASAAPSICAS